MSTPAPSEITFYTDEQGVRVTNTRLIVGSTTYAMGNITSVSRTIYEPSLSGPIFLSAFGALFLFAGFAGSAGLAVFGALLLGAGILWWKGLKVTYGLRISSSSGESTPISSVNREQIEKIVQAVNEAIIGRG